MQITRVAPEHDHKPDVLAAELLRRRGGQYKECMAGSSASSGRDGDDLA